MNNLPREKLKQLIVKYGLTLCDSPQQCEALLRDFCGQYKREIFVLISALKDGVVTELLKSQKGVPQEITLARLNKRLQENGGFSEETSCWAIDSWAIALGVFSQETNLVDYESKLQQYEQKCLQLVEQYFPLSLDANNELNNLRLSLGLAELDVERSKKLIIFQKKADNSQSELRQISDKLKKQEEQLDKYKSSGSKSSNLSVFFGIIILGLGFSLYSNFQETNSLKVNLSMQQNDNNSLKGKVKNLSLTLDNISDNLKNRSDFSPSNTSLKLCNKTSRAVSAAFAYWDGTGWTSKGWLNIQPETCRDEIDIAYGYRKNIYIYGNSSEDTWGSGKYSFCIKKPDKFLQEDSDKTCPTSVGYKKVKMTQFPVFPGVNTWNYK